MGKRASSSFIWNCFLAAVCGTCGATGAKLAFSSSYLHDLLGRLCTLSGSYLDSPLATTQCTKATSLALSVVQAVVVMAINTKGLQYVLKAMHLTNTAIAVLCNSAISFVMSGLIGYLLFAEPIDLYWCVGIALVLVGVWLLNDNEPYMQKHKLPPTSSPSHTHTRQLSSPQQPQSVALTPASFAPSTPSPLLRTGILDKDTLALSEERPTTRMRLPKPPPSPLHVARSGPSTAFMSDLSPLHEDYKMTEPGSPVCGGKCGYLLVCLAALVTGVIPKNSRKQRKKRSIFLLALSGVIIIMLIAVMVRLLTVNVNMLSNKIQ